MEEQPVVVGESPRSIAEKILVILESVFFLLGLSFTLVLMVRIDALLADPPAVPVHAIFVAAIGFFVPYIVTALLLMKKRMGKGFAPKMPVYISRVFSVAMVVALVALGTLIFYMDPKQAVVIEQPVQSPFYSSNIGNFQLTVPDGWSYLSKDTPLVLPERHSKDEFAIHKPGTTCVIAKVNFDRESELRHKQMSFATRVFSNSFQFDGGWYVASTTETSAYEFLWEGRQSVPGEFRVASGFDLGRFLLLTTDGSSVPDECDEDMNTLLSSVETYYEHIVLTKDMQGALISEYIHGLGKAEEGDARTDYGHLVFVADGSSERREVMRFPDGLSWSGDFYEHDDKLYVQAYVTERENSGTPPSHTSSIYSLDPMRGEAVQIPGSDVVGLISSIYVLNDSIYYLVIQGDGGCIDSYKPCPSKLYSLPISGGSPTHVATTEIGGKILGYVAAEQAFYIRRSWGDAGCVSHKISRIIDGTEELLLDEGDCYSMQDAGPYDEMNTRIKNFSESVQAGKLMTNALRFEKGRLVPGGNKENSYVEFYFDRSN